MIKKLKLAYAVSLTYAISVCKDINSKGKYDVCIYHEDGIAYAHIIKINKNSAMIARLN